MPIPAHRREDLLPPPKIVAPPVVRRATRADVPVIVQLQTTCLPHFDLAAPGPAFLRSFYSLVSHDHQGLLFVSECGHKLAGFVVGLSDPPHLYKKIAAEKFHILTVASARLLRHPIQLAKFLGDLRRARRLRYEPDGCSETACELVTMAVQPRLRGQGHGRALVLALAEAAKCNKMNQLRVHIGSNDDGMASFYRKLGFIPLRTFKASDAGWTDEYVLPIQGNGKPN